MDNIIHVLIDDLKSYLDDTGIYETEDIVHDFLLSHKKYYNATDEEIKLIKQLFFGYHPEELPFVQKRRHDALDLYYRAVNGQYDKWNVIISSYNTKEIEDEFFELAKKEGDNNPLIWLVSFIISRSRRDGESFWTIYINYRSMYNLLHPSDKKFILAILGRETDSADDILPDLMAKTLALVKSQ